MTCQYDRYEQCFESCPDCSRYKPHCRKCGGEIDDLTYDGLCFECYIGKKSEKLDSIKDFLLDNDDVREMYTEYLRGLYG